MNIKKIIGIAVGVVLVGWILYGNIQNQKTQPSDKRTVHVILPTTGAISQFGKDMQKSLQFFYNQIDNPQFKLEFYDSGYNPTQVVSIIKQINLFDENPLIINFTSNMSYAALPVLNNKGFMMAGETIEMEELMKFNNYQRFSVLSKNGVENAVKHLLKHHKKIAVINSNDMYGATGIQYFMDFTKGKNIQIIHEQFENNDVSVRDLVQKIISKNPDIDAVYVSASASLAFINLFKELKQQNFQGEIVVLPSFAQKFVIDGLEKNSEGIVFLTTESHLENPRTQKSTEFKKVVEENGLYPNFTVSEGFDMLNLIDKMTKEKKNFNQSEFAKMKEYDGVSGKLFFTGNGNSEYPFVLATIKDGKIIPVEE